MYIVHRHICRQNTHTFLKNEIEFSCLQIDAMRKNGYRDAGILFLRCSYTNLICKLHKREGVLVCLASMYKAQGLISNPHGMGLVSTYLL